MSRANCGESEELLKDVAQLRLCALSKIMISSKTQRSSFDAVALGFLATNSRQDSLIVHWTNIGFRKILSPECLGVNLGSHGDGSVMHHTSAEGWPGM